MSNSTTLKELDIVFITLTHPKEGNLTVHMYNNNASKEECEKFAQEWFSYTWADGITISINR